MIPKKIGKYLTHNPRLLYSARLVYPPLHYKILRKHYQKFIDRKTDTEKLMVNVGGGQYFRRHWKVLDCPSGWYRFVPGTLDYEFDLTGGEYFPFESNSVSFFYSAHTIEHIPQENSQFVLDEFFRCLKPTGVLRLTMPDFDLAVEAFKKNNMEFFEFDGITLEEKFLHFFATYHKGKISNKDLRKDFQELSKTEFADKYTQNIPRETQKVNVGNHINWWNYEKISEMLKKSGFSEVYRSAKQKSKFKELRGEGQNSGFDSSKPNLSLFIEAIK